MGATPWLADNTLAKVSVIVVGVWAATGWHAILYLAYLQSIPSDYYEAATLDGASPRQRFFHITLPLLTPALTISTMLLMVQGLNVFALPVSLTGGGPGYATYTITQTIVVSGISQAQYGQASALGVVFMLAVGLVILVQFRLTRRLEGVGHDPPRCLDPHQCGDAAAVLSDGGARFTTSWSTPSSRRARWRPRRSGFRTRGAFRTTGTPSTRCPWCVPSSTRCTSPPRRSC
ncbi:carbohydrate ABC transporter permease [Streptomyces sp. L7]